MRRPSLLLVLRLGLDLGIREHLLVPLRYFVTGELALLLAVVRVPRAKGGDGQRPRRDAVDINRAMRICTQTHNWQQRLTARYADSAGTNAAYSSIILRGYANWMIGQGGFNFNLQNTQSSNSTIGLKWIALYFSRNQILVMTNASKTALGASVLMNSKDSTVRSTESDEMP